MRIAYINVVGDLFHYGHLQSILFAKSISDKVICGVMTDEVVESYRIKPIANLHERKAIFDNFTMQTSAAEHIDINLDRIEEIGEDWLDSNYFRFGASSLLDDVLRQIKKMNLKVVVKILLQLDIVYMDVKLK